MNSASGFQEAIFHSPIARISLPARTTASVGYRSGLVFEVVSELAGGFSQRHTVTIATHGRVLGC